MTAPAGSSSGRRPKVIVDCDPGLDDAAALAIAGTYCELLGVTTVGGNAPLVDVTQNALITLQVFGLDVEVYAGADRPLVQAPLHAPEIHGTHGFAGPSLPELRRQANETGAVEFIVDTVRKHDDVWLVPTGPLTNIALALRLAPDIADRVAGISFMGGSATIGNHTPVGEFNILADPEAAAMVLGCGAPIYMAGLDLTMQFQVTDTLAEQLQAVGTPGAMMLSELTVAYLDRVETIRGERRGGLHDPVAVLAVTHPELIRHTLRRVDVELCGAHTRGMTVVDQRPRHRDDANVWHGHHLDGAAALAVLLAAVS